MRDFRPWASEANLLSRRYSGIEFAFSGRKRIVKKYQQCEDVNAAGLLFGKTPHHDTQYSHRGRCEPSSFICLSPSFIASAEHCQRWCENFYYTSKSIKGSPVFARSDNSMEVEKMIIEGKKIWDLETKSEDQIFEALNHFQNAALLGSSEAMNLIGLMFFTGKGVKRSATKAFVWFVNAARLKHPSAILMIGKFYCDSTLVKGSYKKCFFWYDLAAENGNPEAMHEVAGMLLEDKGVEYSPHRALKMLEKAVSLGYEPAFETLGMVYEKGLGIHIDLNKAKSAYEKGAGIMHPGCLCRLGRLLLHEKGHPESWSKAFEYLSAAYQKREPSAMGYLGELFENGKGCKKNQGEALKVYLLGSYLNDAYSQYRLASLYLNGRHVTENVDEGLRWLYKSCSKELPEAQYLLGKLHLQGAIIPQDYTAAFLVLLKAAKQNLPKAMHQVGLCYFNGTGISLNYEKAFEWVQKSAVMGCLKACNTLGLMHRDGYGVKKNFNVAFYWIEKAANEGVVEAQCTLGSFFLNGVGTSQNPTEAAAYFKKASAQGSPEGYFNLGALYEKGNGVEQSYGKAFDCYEIAATKGHAKSLYCLGLMFENGRGTLKNEILSLEYYERASRMGDSEAQYRLGLAYEIGYGVEKSEKEAEKWYRVAAEHGNERAEFSLERMNWSYEMANLNCDGSVIDPLSEGHSFSPVTSRVMRETDEHTWVVSEVERIWDLAMRMANQHIRAHYMLQALEDGDRNAEQSQESNTRTLDYRPEGLPEQGDVFRAHEDMATGILYNGFEPEELSAGTSTPGGEVVVDIGPSDMEEDHTNGRIEIIAEGNSGTQYSSYAEISASDALEPSFTGFRFAYGPPGSFSVDREEVGRDDDDDSDYANADETEHGAEHYFPTLGDQFEGSGDNLYHLFNDIPQPEETFSNPANQRHLHLRVGGSETAEDPIATYSLPVLGDEDTTGTYSVPVHGGGNNDEESLNFVEAEDEERDRPMNYPTDYGTGSTEEGEEEKQKDIFDHGVIHGSVHVFEDSLHWKRHLAVEEIIIKNSGRTSVGVTEDGDKHTSILDLGCGEGALMLALLRSGKSKFEKMIGVDPCRKSLKAAKARLAPALGDYATPRTDPLCISLYQGNVFGEEEPLDGCGETVGESYGMGPDVVTCVEVIEHLYPRDLENFGVVTFGRLMPKLAIVTTPNFEFNVILKIANEAGLGSGSSKEKVREEMPSAVDDFPFRHTDHKFEWTRTEFAEWANGICNQFGYSVEFSGVGDENSLSEEFVRDYLKGNREICSKVGYCSQIAIFTRNYNCPPRTTDSFEYMEKAFKLEKFAEMEYPSVFTSGQSNEEKKALTLDNICNEIRYCCKNFCSDKGNDQVVTAKNAIDAHKAHRTQRNVGGNIDWVFLENTVDSNTEIPLISLTLMLSRSRILQKLCGEFVTFLNRQELAVHGIDDANHPDIDSLRSVLEYAVLLDTKDIINAYGAIFLQNDGFVCLYEHEYNSDSDTSMPHIDEEEDAEEDADDSNSYLETGVDSYHHEDSRSSGSSSECDWD
eukprot:Nk52_evm7s378 gene=Nk52_evmTU7s378